MCDQIQNVINTDGCFSLSRVLHLFQNNNCALPPILRLVQKVQLVVIITQQHKVMTVHKLIGTSYGMNHEVTGQGHFQSGNWSILEDLLANSSFCSPANC